MRGESLRSANKTAIIGPNALAITFSARYNSAYDTCSNDASLDAIRAALKRQTGSDWQVRVEQARPDADGPGDEPRAHPTPARADFRTLPLFKRAKDVLDAELVNVDDDFDPTAKPSDWTDPDIPEDTAPIPEPDEA